VGFEIMIEIEAGGTSSKVNQFDEDGKVASQISGSVGPAGSFNAGSTDAYFGDARRAAWYIEHTDLGRLTVGRWDAANTPGIIDLTAAVGLPASGSLGLLNGGFFLRGSAGQYYAIQWNNIVETGFASANRSEQVRYDSPTWNGFIYSTMIAEAGDYWSNLLRYANEFNGVRIAAAVGYEKIKDRSTPATLDPTAAFWTGPQPDLTTWGASLSLMHVPTGLFIQGNYQHVDYGAPNHVTAGYWADAGGATQKDFSMWLIQGGIAKNWFGSGNTSLYAEYGKENDLGAASAGRTFAGNTSTASCTVGAVTGTANAVCSSTLQNFTAVAGVTDTTVTMWGLGLVQNFSAAATDVYIGYRHFDADILCNTANCGSAATGATAGKLPTQSIDVIVGGARVLF
jgi:hypothetical protein